MISLVLNKTFVFTLLTIVCITEFLRAKILAGDAGPTGPVYPVGPVTTESAPVAPVFPVYPVYPVVPVGPVLPVAPSKVPSTVTLPCIKMFIPVCPILILPSLESIKKVPVPVS